jgi:hypothetical protein
MAKATKTIRQALSYQPAHSSYFVATKDLFNQVAAFYFEVITLHEQVLHLSTKEALTALEKLTHTTKANPRPVMPLSADIPAMFRRAAIHAALGSAHSFYTQLAKWRKQKERARARGKKFSIRPEVASAQVEPQRHAICWTMERAHSTEHPAQALDRGKLGVDKMPHSRTCHPRWMGCSKPSAGAGRTAVEIAHRSPEEVLSTWQSGTASRKQCCDTSLFH